MVYFQSFAKMPLILKYPIKSTKSIIIFMSTKYEIVFLPNASKDSIIFDAQEKTLLSIIRSKHTTLTEYHFLNKKDAIIDQNQEGKLTIEEILRDKNQIFMSKTKGNPQIKADQLITIYLVLEDGQNQKKKTVIKASKQSTLEDILNGNKQLLSEYQFLGKSNQIIGQDYLKQFKVNEVLQDDKSIHLKKKQKKIVGQKDYYISVKGLANKINIKAQETDTIQVLRKNYSQLKDYVFITLNGAHLAEYSEKRTTVSQISSNNTINMTVKVDEKAEVAAKKKQIQIEQQKAQATLKKLMDTMQVIKGNEKEKEEERKKKWNEISGQLQKYGLPIQPSKLPNDLQRTKIVQTLMDKKKSSQDIIKSAKQTPEKTQAERFAQDGRFLPSIYKTKKKASQTTNIVNFGNSQVSYRNQYKHGYKTTIIEYKATGDSKVKVDIQKQLQSDFNGGTLTAGGYGVTAQVSASNSEVYQSQTVNTAKEVKAGQIFNQTYIALLITNAVVFEKQNISLKQHVVIDFENIVSDYQKTGDSIQLHRSINEFTNNYGIGLSSSVYLMGGYYHNTINYVFYSGASSAQLNTITSTQSQFSLKGGVSGSYGGFTAGVGYEKETRSTDAKAFKIAGSKNSVNYRTSYKHDANPLLSIGNIDQWISLMEAFPQNWVVVGKTEGTQIPITQLLKTPRNSIKNQPEFLKVKAQVIQEFLNPKKPVIFNFDLESTINPITYKNYFFLRLNQVTKQEGPFKEYQILGKKVFPKNIISFYDVKILRSQDMEIALGICGESCKNNEYSVAKNNNSIYYHLAGRGTIEYGQKQYTVGKVIKINDVIRVQVDLKAAVISWFKIEKGSVPQQINGIPLAKQDIPTQILKEQSIYPYFQMLTDEDKIMIN